MMLFTTSDLFRLRHLVAAEIQRLGPAFKVNEFFSEESPAWNNAVSHLIEASRDEDLELRMQLGHETFGPGSSTIDNPANMSVQETAKYLKVATQTNYKWVSQGKLPHIKIGGKKLGFNQEALDKFLARDSVADRVELEREATRRTITSGARGNYSRRT